MLSQRGEIRYLERLRQVLSFTGMERHRRITPTDIDGFIDYNGRSFVFLEGKEVGRELGYGQRLMLENLVTRSDAGGCSSIAILFSHDTGSGDVIIMKDCHVTKTFRERDGKYLWLPPTRQITVLETIEMWEGHLTLNGIVI